MTLHLDLSPRSAGTRRLLIGIAAVTGLVCGAGGALAQGRGAQPTPAAPPPAPSAPAIPPAPSPMAHRVFALGSGPATYTFKSKEDGREFELRLENNEVVAAKINGQDVPGDRISREGNTILFKDDRGVTVFEHSLPASSELRITTSLGPRGTLNVAPSVAGSRQGRLWSGTIPGPDPAALAEASPPSTMLGVIMMEPDATLRGHFGLEPGTATLVGAVYGDLPADAAGLEPYDIIIAIGGSKPADTETIRKALREKKPGDEVKFTVIHRGKEREATVKLEKYNRDRFDETKVRSIAAVMDEDAAATAIWLRSAADASGNGGVVGINPDPNNPVSTFYPAPAGSQMQQLLQEAREARERALEEAARSLELADQLRDKSSLNKSMEERMRRLEEMLQQLLDEKPASGKSGGAGGGGGAGAEPAPDDLLPSRGLWAARNPAA